MYNKYKKIILLAIVGVSLLIGSSQVSKNVVGDGINTLATLPNRVKVSSNDTTVGFLNGKLVAGSNITFTENNNGGNETLTIAATGGGGGGGGDALTTDPLSQFASTTSAQLAGVISDETGSGKLVFATDPRFETNTGLRVTSTGGTPNSFQLINTGGKAVELDNSLITVDRIQKFPDVSGTYPVGTGTSNQIAYWSGTNTLASLTTATYPSLTELSYLKGVTSALQTQLDARVADTGDTITGTYSITGQLNLDNLRLDGNTISSTNSNGDVTIAPNGTGMLVVPDGSTSIPGISFTSDLDTGISRSSTANTGLLMAGGADRFSWNTTTFAGTSSNSALILRGTGSDSTPSFSQISDTNTGIVLPGSDVLGLTTAGTRALTINASQQVSIPKGITPRVVTTTDDSTAVIDVTATDVYELSAVANNTTFSFTGTAVDGQKILIRYKDAGASKTLTWTGFTAIGVTLPTATTTSKWGYVGVVYNSAAGQWHAVAVTTQT